MKTNIIRDLKKFRPVIFILILFLVGCNDSKKENKETIRFGVCADVHKEIMHDVDLRLKIFVNKMKEKDVDFIIQLGDFCQPQIYNEPFMDIWNSFEGSKYHVLGNHDMTNHMDSVRFTPDQTAKYYGMPNRYYSFDKNGFHFIVLDGNDKTDLPQGGSAPSMGIEQLTWLKKSLYATNLPVVIFSHQSIEWAIENAVEVRKILEESNRQSEKKKVIACFSGHHHCDHAAVINGIYYIHINSLSYKFLGKDYIHLERYSKRIDIRFPKIKEVAPYKDPLYAIVTIEKNGIIKIEGTESEWVGPSPKELGRYNKLDSDSAAKMYEMAVPKISNRLLKPFEYEH